MSIDGSAVVGSDICPATIGTVCFSAFRWTDGTRKYLESLPNKNVSQAFGVNSDGTVIVGLNGDRSAAAFNATQPVRWAYEKIGALGPGSVTTSAVPDEARGANSDGSVIVGTMSGQATRWVNGVPSGLGFLSGGTVSH
jgi:uncharacterized membrane protein